MKTRVLVVDDSPLIRAVLRDAFDASRDLEVVGEADNGEQAVAMVKHLRPDVVTMDVLMPVMDGKVATQRIMRECPTAIVVVARDGGDSAALALDALAWGALEAFPKPANGFDDAATQDLVNMVMRVAQMARAPLPQTASRDGRIRVLIVDDSALIRAALGAVLSVQPDMEVVGEAGDGMTAVALAAQLRPDVITMDLLMPMMDGAEAILRILKQSPAGVLVVAGDTGGAEGPALRDLARGALEFFRKPPEGLDERSAHQLLAAVRRVARAWRSVAGSRSLRNPTPVRPSDVAAIGIVGSTGAPRVLRDLVHGLPSDFPTPIVVVQHTERGLVPALVDWLACGSVLPVRLARAGDVLVPGRVLVAPDDMHVEVALGGRLDLRQGDAVDGFRPSGTVLLHSLAATFGHRALGLVLSGMGTDGAAGLGAIYAAGGTAVVEDPATAVVAGMPDRALSRATGAYVARADRLPRLLVELVG
jgi:two-component system chemotaxis response regulator CheB